MNDSTNDPLNDPIRLETNGTAALEPALRPVTWSNQRNPASLGQPLRNGGTLAATADRILREQAFDNLPELEDPTLDEFAAEAGTERPWVIQDLLVNQTVSAIIGPPRSYKSMLALNMAAAIAGTATTFLGYQIKQHGPVLYVAQEGERVALSNRLLGMRQIYGTDHDIRIIYRKALHINDDLNLEQLRRRILDRQPVLVVLDTFRKSHQLDENSSGDMQEIMDRLDNLSLDTNTAITFVHHTNKGQAMSPSDASRGSTAIIGSVEGTILVRTEFREGAATGRGKLLVESKDTETTLFGFGIDPHTLQFRKNDGVMQPTSDSLARIVGQLAAMDVTPTTNAIFDQWELTYGGTFGKSRRSELLQNAVKEGRLTKHTIKQGAARYDLPLLTDTDIDQTIEDFLDDHEAPE